MALPQPVIDGRLALIAAKAQLDIAFTKSLLLMATAKAAGNVKLYNYAYGAQGKISSARSNLDGVHSDIAVGLLDIYGEAEVGPVIMAPGR